MIKILAFTLLVTIPVSSLAQEIRGAARARPSQNYAPAEPAISCEPVPTSSFHEKKVTSPCVQVDDRPSAQRQAEYDKYKSLMADAQAECARKTRKTCGVLSVNFQETRVPTQLGADCTSIVVAVPFAANQNVLTTRRQRSCEGRPNGEDNFLKKARTACEQSTGKLCVVTKLELNKKNSVTGKCEDIAEAVAVN